MVSSTHQLAIKSFPGKLAFRVAILGSPQSLTEKCVDILLIPAETKEVLVLLHEFFVLKEKMLHLSLWPSRNIGKPIYEQYTDQPMYEIGQDGIDVKWKHEYSVLRAFFNL